MPGGKTRVPPVSLNQIFILPELEPCGMLQWLSAVSQMIFLKKSKHNHNLCND